MAQIAKSTKSTQKTEAYQKKQMSVSPKTSKAGYA